MMTKFSLRLLELQPSQLYISQEKLSAVNYTFFCGGTNILEAPSVTKMNGRWVITEGHTRCLAHYLHGSHQLQVQIEPCPLDLAMYTHCLKWCQEAHIFNISDLASRIIPHTAFEQKWIQRCQSFQKTLQLNPK